MAKDVYIWTTSNGTRIPVTEMSDKHLDNAIKMLERKGRALKERMETGWRDGYNWKHYVPVVKELEKERRRRIAEKRKTIIVRKIGFCPRKLEE